MSLHKTLLFPIESDNGSISYQTACSTVFTEIGGGFANVTTSANNSTASDVTIPFTSGDSFYIRTASTSTNILFVDVVTAGSATRVPEYWNGSSWASLSITWAIGSDNLTADAIGYFDPPSDWASTTVNGVDGIWIRFRSTAGSSGTIITSCSIGQFVEKTVTLSLPENTNRTIKNAWAKIFAYTDSSAIWSIRAPLIQYRIDSGSWNAVVLNNLSLVQTGEHIPVEFLFDITSAMASGLNGTSHTLTIRFSMIAGVGGGNSTTWSNPGGVVGITYTADAQATRIKTVAIPLASSTSQLSTTAITMDTIPQLSTFLPEASVSIVTMFFEVQGNTVHNAAGTGIVTLSLDAESGTAFTITNPLTTAVWYYLIWVRDDMSTGSTHSFKAKSNTTSLRCPGMTIVLWVTYTYDHSSSTTILNSLQLPFLETSGYGSESGRQADYASRNVWVQEPGTITIQQSALSFRFSSASTNSNNIVINTGTATTFSTYQTLSGGAASGYSLQVRVDSDWSLSRGENSFGVSWSTGAVRKIAGMTAILFLNYTSGKHTSGDEYHSRTIMNCIIATPNTAISNQTYITTNIIDSPMSEYWVVGIGFLWGIIGSGTYRPANLTFEDPGGIGWVDAFVGWTLQANEIGYFEIISRVRDLFKRFPEDIDPNRILDLDNNSTIKLETPAASADFLLGYTTYHSISYTLAGTISGYSGDGSGITVDIFRSDTDELVGSVVSTLGGSYSFTWYDNVIALYAVARQDSTHVGRSDNLFAS